MVSLDLKSEVFASFVFYATIAVAKMMFMALLTARQRFKNMVFANPEDVKGIKDLKPNLNDDRVERVRRNHLNDLENIPAFVLLGFFYVLTGPSLFAANMHFRIFVGARIFHTIAYQLPIPQPSRALAFMVSFATMWSMVIQIVRSFM